MSHSCSTGHPPDHLSRFPPHPPSFSSCSPLEQVSGRTGSSLSLSLTRKAVGMTQKSVSCSPAASSQIFPKSQQSAQSPENTLHVPQTFRFLPESSQTKGAPWACLDHVDQPTTQSVRQQLAAAGSIASPGCHWSAGLHRWEVPMTPPSGSVTLLALPQNSEQYATG